ncbi:hypothetical protein LJ739_12025 [Aestuariibacter halophilus]|uniref:Uncharacterized protein n=1 Tax=Fluctibacter halophilus TaxID=226011 RepID=A0ABS8G8V0_9ALTE|nr:hypothetical protein [Aestuariibacter halophilus]MCC2616970.1 hypothetical protein [Aestuariibacter halophilus]
MSADTALERLWQAWESSVVQRGFDARETQALLHEIEKKVAHGDLPAPTQHNTPSLLRRAHQRFDQWILKRQGKQPAVLAHCEGMRTRFGAVYEDPVAVRGLERLMLQRPAPSAAIKLPDGFYHINSLPGVQPNGDVWRNACHKTVERVNCDVVEAFVKACRRTGMDKRGWKKAVYEQFAISRQEMAKWLQRYLPHYNLDPTGSGNP